MLTNIRDLDYKLLNQLEDRELVNVCLTNKQANKICNDQDFWFQRILIKFHYIPLEILRKYKGNRTWSEYYINDLRRINYENKDKYLYNGSFDGGLDQVMIAIHLGANIHFNNDIALSRASKNGHLDVVKYLVEKGADIHAEKYEALIWSSEDGHLDVVKYLVEKGADIHANNDEALRLASENGHLEVVKYLVEKGADIHTLNDRALRWAKNAEIVNYLKSLP